MNALNELADALDMFTELSFDEQIEVAEKAKKIIRELAKVGDTTLPTFDGRGFVTVPNCTTSIMAVSKCRAIAEEGADNGK